MSNEPRLNEQEQADLVSYLDGELDAQSAQALEARLARDPSVRAEADALRRTWEMLDYLPRPEPSAEFTQRTLESLSLIRPSAAQGVLPHGSRFHAWRWVAAALLAWLAGFAALMGYYRWLQPGDAIDPQLVADLRVLEHFKAYLAAADLEVVRALDVPELFAEEVAEHAAGPPAPGGPPAAVAPLTADEWNHNRAQLERWRADGEHYQRLRQDLQAFKALTTDQQDRLRRLDRGLHEEDSMTQQRLLGVLERYVCWLDRLPGEARERVAAAEAPEDRIRTVRDLREREWVAQLPRQRREKVEAARTVPERTTLIAQYREEERAFRRQWARALRPRGPEVPQRGSLLRFADLPEEVQSFVNRSLQPLLTADERKRLDAAEGEGPKYVQVLVELTEAHAFAVPGSEARPTRFLQLPQAVKRHLPKNNDKDKADPEYEVLARALGKNPDYAVEVVRMLRKKRAVALVPGTPCHPADFDPPVQDFLKQRLLPALDKDEKARLQAAEGQWPEYPQRLVELAQKKEMRIPSMMLPPGAQAFWAQLSVGLPPVPQGAMQDFLRSLTPAERLELNLVSDGSGRERLTEAYYRRNPGRLQDQLKKDYGTALRRASAAYGK